MLLTSHPLQVCSLSFSFFLFQDASIKLCVFIRAWCKGTNPATQSPLLCHCTRIVCHETSAKHHFAFSFMDVIALWDHHRCRRRRSPLEWQNKMFVLVFKIVLIRASPTGAYRSRVLCKSKKEGIKPWCLYPCKPQRIITDESVKEIT